MYKKSHEYTVKSVMHLPGGGGHSHIYGIRGCAAQTGRFFENEP
jgi:hypothetical protein